MNTEFLVGKLKESSYMFLKDLILAVVFPAVIISSVNKTVAKNVCSLN